MIDRVGAAPAQEWVGALVLAVAPAALMARVSDAVARAEAAVLGDPVLGDRARVATSAIPDPLAGGIDDIEEAWERDTASFVRRGLTEEPHHVVVFLAGEPPTGSAESVRRLAELGAAAEVVWVTFAPQAPEATDDFRATGTLFFRDHDDVVNEIVQLLREAEASRKPGSAG